jgi:hypothetical protein
MGEGPFECGTLTHGLNLRPDLNQASHGFVEPATITSLRDYQACLEATRDLWIVDERIE